MIGDSSPHAGGARARGRKLSHPGHFVSPDSNTRHVRQRAHGADSRPLRHARPNDSRACRTRTTHPACSDLLCCSPCFAARSSQAAPRRRNPPRTPRLRRRTIRRAPASRRRTIRRPTLPIAPRCRRAPAARSSASATRGCRIARPATNAWPSRPRARARSRARSARRWRRTPAASATHARSRMAGGAASTTVTTDSPAGTSTRPTTRGSAWRCAPATRTTSQRAERDAHAGAKAATRLSGRASTSTRRHRSGSGSRSVRFGLWPVSACAAATAAWSFSAFNGCGPSAS